MDKTNHNEVSCYELMYDFYSNLGPSKGPPPENPDDIEVSTDEIPKGADTSENIYEAPEYWQPDNLNY